MSLWINVQRNTRAVACYRMSASSDTIKYSTELISPLLLSGWVGGG